MKTKLDILNAYSQFFGENDTVLIEESIGSDEDTVDSSCSAGVSVESHNTALDAMRAVQIEII